MGGMNRRMLFKMLLASGFAPPALAKGTPAMQAGMRVVIETIAHARQRYETAGDWRIDGTATAPSIAVKVSKMGDWRYELLVGLHEMVEAALCRQRGIGEAQVTAFDEAFEKARAAGNTDEPGDELAAPYHREHIFASKIERLMAVELGVDWTAYEAAVG